ncbi:FlgK family flagellar hook-associated protein, partial [Rhodobaculum claviforme]
LETLSEWMDVSTFQRDNGAIAVMGKMSDGSTKMMVDSREVQFDFSKASALGPVATSSDGFPTLSSAPSPAAASDQLGPNTGGKLGALLDVRDNMLTDFHRDLDRLTQVVRDRVNAAHNQGTYQNQGQATLTGSADISSDTFSSPATGSLTVNYTNASNEVIGSATVSIAGDTSVADVQASLAGTLASTVNADGQLELSLPGGAPAGATGFTLNTGDATIASTELGDTRGFSHYFGLNNLFETPDLPLLPSAGAGDITGAAGDIQVRSDIKQDSANLSYGSATQYPSPAPATNPPAVYAGDNTVAQAMADSFEDRSTIAASGGNLRNVNTTMSGYAADLLSFQASETSRTDTARDFQQTMYDELKFRSDSKSGVNIDEELSNMLVFEQAYNASARVISTVQQMFDTLDRMMN